MVRIVPLAAVLTVLISSAYAEQFPSRSSAPRSGERIRTSTAACESLGTGLPLDPIGQISPASGNNLVFGDTDHDGRNEVILKWRDENFVWSYRILEEQGNNVYTEEYRGPVNLNPMVAKDLDGDGKAEILGQFSNELRIYESLDAASHPSQLVWSLVTPSNVLRFTTAADTDRDGRMEIIHNLGVSMLILEAKGDNTFEQVFLQPATSGGGGEFVIGDLDGDGLIEIAFPDVADGRVVIYESPANDTWVQTWVDSTELDLPRAAEGGRDTDGNGLPELFVMGNTWDAKTKTVYWTTIVYEATGDNSFARVGSFSQTDGANGATFNALGNLDGVGGDEYVMEGLYCLWIYQACAHGQWRMIQAIVDPGPVSPVHDGLFISDSNRNGRSELFWTTSATNSTRILEYPYASDANMDFEIRVHPLSIHPNPCSSRAFLLAPGAASHAARLAVFDAAGRLLDRRPLQGGAQGHHVWTVKGIPSGVYFLRLESSAGSTLATGRAVVAR